MTAQNPQPTISSGGEAPTPKAPHVPASEAPLLVLAGDAASNLDALYARLKRDGITLSRDGQNLHLSPTPAPDVLAAVKALKPYLVMQLLIDEAYAALPWQEPRVRNDETAKALESWRKAQSEIDVAFAKCDQRGVEKRLPQLQAAVRHYNEAGQ